MEDEKRTLSCVENYSDGNDGKITLDYDKENKQSDARLKFSDDAERRFTVVMGENYDDSLADNTIAVEELVAMAGMHLLNLHVIGGFPDGDVRTAIEDAYQALKRATVHLHNYNKYAKAAKERK